MTTYEIIANLCEKHGIAVTALEKELGFGRGYIGKLRTKGTSPTAKKLQQIADYFNVSVEYLINGEEKDRKYYLNDETAQVAQEIFENKELRALFDVQRDMEPEDLKALHQMALALKRKERGEDDDTGC